MDHRRQSEISNRQSEIAGLVTAPLARRGIYLYRANAGTATTEGKLVVTD